METRTPDHATILRNTVLHGDCIPLMHDMSASSVDFILTDPPYLIDYRDRDGRRIPNDNNARWLRPAFAEMYRLLKLGGFSRQFLRLEPCRPIPFRMGDCGIPNRHRLGFSGTSTKWPTS